MQRLSVEQVAILTILNEFDIAEEYQVNKRNNVVEVPNKERLDDFIMENDWNPREVDNIIEELEYWKYIDKKCKVTILGRQYLKTGPEDLMASNNLNAADKQYNFTLFEKIVDFGLVNITKESGSTFVKAIGALAEGLKRK